MFIWVYREYQDSLQRETDLRKRKMKLDSMIAEASEKVLLVFDLYPPDACDLTLTPERPYDCDGVGVG